ncbi:MFS transporter [Plantactinospora sp. KBS50]|uniref:MFS transporter n=1 Tax=Plantactinospora sp. KBS50 TaxID=2024580 RepID=UPI000BAAE5FE|nr:MFS transporter [Plantactinospora sp. KBS50]ASW56327.1 MFS transporter [Plantactinospora sp. KBS50]
MEALLPDKTHGRERPATFREVFAGSEYRALFAASALSWIGDYITKAAVMVLVYQQTSSVALSAAAFAVSYLPWLVGGPLLAAIAERYPYRNVMIICDLLRMVLVALVAIPGMPVWSLLALLFTTTLLTAPAQAARSATMPQILPGDRLVVGLSLNTSTGQAAQVLGYVLGAAIASVQPHYALLLDAATFAASATLIRFGIRFRLPATTGRARRHLLHETGDGFRLVFGRPVLRAIAILVFATTLFAIVPEGLAAGWADERTTTEAGRGLAQALIMASNPLGFIVGSLFVGRLLRPEVRQALVRPLAILAPVALVPALLDPSPIVVAGLSAVCGFAVAGLTPVANGLFVRALPDGYRARAFGVMATGLQITQGGAVLVTGLLADHFRIPMVVGVWSLAGVLLVGLAALYWPSPERFDQAIAAAQREAPGPEAPVLPGQPNGTDQGRPGRQTRPPGSPADAPAH